MNVVLELSSVKLFTTILFCRKPNSQSVFSGRRYRIVRLVIAFNDVTWSERVVTAATPSVAEAAGYPVKVLYKIQYKCINVGETRVSKQFRLKIVGSSFAFVFIHSDWF